MCFFLLFLQDVYSSRPLPYLIGTAEFLHDETLGLLEILSDDEGKKVESSDGDSDEEESEDEDSEETVRFIIVRSP